MNENHNDLIPEDEQGLVSDFLTFLKEEKIWWVLPIVILLALLALVLVLGETNAVLAPFLYPFV